MEGFNWATLDVFLNALLALTEVSKRACSAAALTPVRTGHQLSFELHEPLLLIVERQMVLVVSSLDTGVFHGENNTAFLSV